jgi:outer membrane autotransporter protein
MDTSTTALNNFIGVAMERVEQTLKLAKIADSASTGISAGDAAKLNGIWGKGYGSYLTQGTRNGIAGYDAWNAGTALGVDRLFGNCVTLGISGGYAYGDVDAKVNNASTYINSAQTTIYGGYEDKNLPYFIDAAGSFAWNWYDGQRDVNVGGAIVRTANAAYDGQQYGAYIGGGYRFDITKNIEFTPLLSLQYNHLHTQSYTETEAGALSLSVASQDYDQLQTGLGARIASPIACKWGTFTPEAHGKWFYDFIGDPMVVGSNFTGGGPSFDSNGAKPALNSFNAGGELTFAFKNDVSLVASCDTEMKDEFFGIYGSATVRYNF